MASAKRCRYFYCSSRGGVKSAGLGGGRGIRQPVMAGEIFGAGNGIRTRDFDLGKVALYH